MKDKHNKMLPQKIVLGACPQCKKKGINPNESYRFCLFCGWEDIYDDVFMNGYRQAIEDCLRVCIGVKCIKRITEIKEHVSKKL